MGVRTAERMTGVVLSVTCTDPVQVRCGKSMPKQAVCHLRDQPERSSWSSLRQGVGRRSTPAESLSWVFSVTVGRAEGEPIALEAALGRGRLYARSVCDAAPACGPEGHRLAPERTILPIHYGTMSRPRTSSVTRSMNAPTGITSCFFPAPRTLSARLSDSTSRCPSTAMYGTFCSSPSRTR